MHCFEKSYIGLNEDFLHNGSAFIRSRINE